MSSILGRPEPINVIASEQPTTCPIDGTRTKWIGPRTDEDGEAYNLEECPKCYRYIHVYEPEEGEENDADE